MKRLLLLLALFLPTPLMAELVYLDCKIDGALGDIEVTLNEREREVTYLYNTGKSWTNAATFTKDKILFGDQYRSWTIDRTNGRIFFRAEYYGVVSEQDGSCKKAEKTKTLF